MPINSTDTIPLCFILSVLLDFLDHDCKVNWDGLGNNAKQHDGGAFYNVVVAPAHPRARILQ